ncbi:class I SAM-dependent methyltransferase [Streptomyces daliensis]|uniref:Class I SAM-dependent methyltransferase n=1 Tax=Streptomyces daliensis TaxID=299421 RepID=A0A8T4INT1_9ACTN|nr:class I SAM-dependent methyltransferase [Streptomyces daliensis]
MPSSTPGTPPVPPRASFDSAYETGVPPWVIGEPQPAVVELERSGAVRGAVLDPGCGTGEHTILLTRLGYDVLGADFAPHAIQQARANAERQGVAARFAAADALRLAEELGEDRFDTVVDSALFHVFGPEDRAAYVRSLHAVTRPAAVVHILALADTEPGFGPRIAESVLRDAFTEAAGWRLEGISATTYGGRVPAGHAEALGLAPGSRTDVPAWLATAHRI